MGDKPPSEESDQVPNSQPQDLLPNQQGQQPFSSSSVTQQEVGQPTPETANVAAQQGVRPQFPQQRYTPGIPIHRYIPGLQQQRFTPPQPQSFVPPPAKQQYGLKPQSAENDSKIKKPAMIAPSHANRRRNERKAGKLGLELHNRSFGMHNKKRASSEKGKSGVVYDPDKERSPKGISYWQTYVHLVRSSIGEMVLLLPYLFVKAGLISGIIYWLIFTAIIMHCINISLKIIYKQCKRLRVPVLQFHEALRVLLEQGPKCLRRYAKCGSYIALVFIGLLQSCHLTKSLKFIVKILSTIFNEELTPEICTLVAGLVTMIFNLVPDLKFLIPFSILGIIAMAVLLTSMTYFSCTFPKPENATLELTGSLLYVPSFLSGISLALVPPAMFYTLEYNMKSPAELRGTYGIFNKTFALCSLLTIAFVAVGYNYCRSECSVYIFNHFFDTIDRWLFEFLVACLVYCLANSFVLHCQVLTDMVMNIMQKRKPHMLKRKYLMIYITKTTIFAVIFLITLGTARTSVVIYLQLICAILMPLTLMVIPAVMDGLESESAFTWIKDTSIIVLGIATLVAGASASTQEIIDKINK